MLLGDLDATTSDLVAEAIHQAAQTLAAGLHRLGRIEGVQHTGAEGQCIQQVGAQQGAFREVLEQLGAGGGLLGLIHRLHHRLQQQAALALGVGGLIFPKGGITAGASTLAFCALTLGLALGVGGALAFAFAKEGVECLAQAHLAIALAAGGGAGLQSSACALAIAQAHGGDAVAHVVYTNVVAVEGVDADACARQIRVLRLSGGADDAGLRWPLQGQNRVWNLWDVLLNNRLCRCGCDRVGQGRNTGIDYGLAGGAGNRCARVNDRAEFGALVAIHVVGEGDLNTHDSGDFLFCAFVEGVFDEACTVSVWAIGKACEVVPA